MMVLYICLVSYDAHGEILHNVLHQQNAVLFSLLKYHQNKEEILAISKENYVICFVIIFKKKNFWCPLIFYIQGFPSNSGSFFKKNCAFWASSTKKSPRNPKTNHQISLLLRLTLVDVIYNNNKFHYPCISSSH